MEKMAPGRLSRRAPFFREERKVWKFPTKKKNCLIKNEEKGLEFLGEIYYNE